MTVSRWSWITGASLLLVASHSSGAGERSLVNHSPFQPPALLASPTPAKPTETRNRITERLEFRGFFEIGGNWSFSIYDKTKRISHWLSLDQFSHEENFLIADFDRLSPRVLIEWGADQAYIELHVAGAGGGALRPRGSIAGVDSLRDPPPAPPAFNPPPAPPPPPVTSPPAGPPPEIPRAVLAQYEQMLAEEGQRDRVSGAILGGGPPSARPGGGASTTLTGLPPALRPGLPPGGVDSGASEPGTVARPGTGVAIPGLPTGVPGAPPGPPPSIVIPEIPDFPED